MTTVYSDVGTAYATLYAALTDGGALWGLQAYAEFAPRNTSGGIAITRPYVVYSFAGGGDVNGVMQADPELVIDVIGVADALAQALQMAEEIRARLDDHGELDTVRIAGNASYAFKTCTHEARIHFVERVQNVAPIYHSGGRYRVALEKR